MYQALYRKWRPRTFDDVVGQEHITKTLARQIETGRLSHAYLFTGTRGTGKTTCAKLLARAVNCQAPHNGNPCNKCESCLGIENGSILDVLELDAASNNRVDDIRAILDEAAYTPAAVKKRVYIVDEVHMLSAQAFNALLQILEEPPEHLMFILATTELHKVPATIKSRCQQFAFKRIRVEDISRRLLFVAEQEQIRLTESGAALIARLADGGMRDALSLLDQCAGAGERIDETRIYEVLGLAGNLETAALMDDIAGGDASAALERLNRLYGGGKEMTALVGELSSLVRDLLVRKSAPESGAALMTGGFDELTLKRLEQSFGIPRLVQMLTLLQRTAADLTRSSNRRTDVELCLTILCDPSLDQTPAGLNARVTRLEQEGFSASHADKIAASEPNREEKPHSLSSEASAETGVKPCAAVEMPLAAPPTENWPGWHTLRAALKDKMPMGVYSFLGDPEMVDGQWEGNTLILWANSDFIKGIIEKKDILEQVAGMASSMVGKPIHVSVRVGNAPVGQKIAPAIARPSVEQDPLEAFLADGGENLTVE